MPSTDKESPDDLYIRSAQDIETEGMPIVDLQVEDPRFPGRVFHGTYESVLQEMETLQPEVEVPETLVAERDEDTHELERRQAVVSVPFWSLAFLGHGLQYDNRSPANGAQETSGIHTAPKA